MKCIPVVLKMGESQTLQESKMKRILLAIICVAGMVSGCIEPPEAQDEMTKEDAKKKQKTDSKDLCDAFGWYGDGVCDDFCPNLDPDCAVNCLAIPVCEDHEVEVESCEGLLSCSEHSMCGTTIFCDAGISNCEAYPACGPGQIEVETCPADSSCVEASVCGYTIFCMDTVQCAAYPSCPPHSIEMACDPSTDPGCVEVTMCGSRITCQEEIYTCDAIPVCPEHATEVESCNLLGVGTCEELSVCGTTIYCYSEMAVCLAYPSCPIGYDEVPACDPGSDCTTATMCGTTITCQANGQAGTECVQDSDCMRTGCSGTICAAEDVITTCEYLPHYACYNESKTSCGCNNGFCGFEQTPEHTSCLNAP